MNFATRKIAGIFLSFCGGAMLPGLAAALPVDPAGYAQPVRVACIGDSITAGVGAAPGQAYPAQLQKLLGENWEVRNFGVSGRTLLRKGDAPYWREQAFNDARAFQPDVVVILLGANDSKPQNWKYRDEFARDYTDLVNAFRELPGRPRVYVCRPTPVPAPGNFGINEKAVQEEIAIIDRLAGTLKLEEIDLHAALEGHPAMLPDRVHPNTDGAAAMAGAVALAIAGENPPRAPIVHLNSLFCPHAVFQCGVHFPIRGTAPSGTTVTVEFAGQKISTVAKDGTWEVKLKPLRASATPQTLTVTGGNKIVVPDIVVGDVWVASGQSNMERQLGPRGTQKEIVGWKEAAAAADFPDIRQYYVPEHRALSPAADAGGTWTVCTPQTAPDFTAVGFFFARDVHQAEHVPIGIIFSAWGGTVAEAWTSAESLTQMPDFRDAVKSLQAGSGPKTFAERREQWFQERDPGISNHWSAAGFNAESWTTTNLPATFGGAFDGVIWFRKNIELPESWDGQGALLHLGTIDDEDTAWVNGVQVGATARWDARRNYKVPAGILKAGRNTIVIRAVNTGGDGGFGGKPEQLNLEPAGAAGGDSIPLAGEWLSRVAVGMQKLSETFPRDVEDRNPNVPTVLYNAMIAPLQRFPIKGVIWYQGEQNNDRARQYRELFPLLIADWRRGWSEGDFPFLFVQIAPHQGMRPEIREAQFLTLARSPNTAMAVTADVGDATDIHPARKGPVGARLALAARALAYGEKLEYSGPQFESLKVKGKNAVLSFTHVDGGLVAQGGELRGFTIAGADKKFVSAKAEISGRQVIVSSDAVPNPVAVRYGWSNVPDVNLFNHAGLPASPFRSDPDATD